MRWYPRDEDISLERWKEIIAAFPAGTRHFCAWTGGEPLLRASDIAELSRLFRWNWIATSGTVAIPDIPHTTVFVSVDGPQRVHDEVRSGWDDVVRNVRPDHYIACTLQRRNSDPELLREHVGYWRSRAAGMVFGFLTPRGDDERSLDRAERATVLAELGNLRRRYGRFVIGVPGQLADSVATAWAPTCPAETSLVTFDARGRRKRPCTLGPDVDCSRCGCAVPGFLRRVMRLHLGTLLDVTGLFA
jgi:organic radical activating enzyme